MNSLIRPLEATTRSVGFAAALLLIPLVFASVYEVFSRYVLSAPTYWAFELGYMLMGAHFLLGGALTLQRGQHVRIDFIYGALPMKTKATIDLIIYLVLLLPCMTLVTIELVEFAHKAFLSGERSGQSAWNPPIWPLRAIFAFAFAVMVLQVIAEIIKCIDVLRGVRATEETL